MVYHIGVFEMITAVFDIHGYIIVITEHQKPTLTGSAFLSVYLRIGMPTQRPVPLLQWKLSECAKMRLSRPQPLLETRAHAAGAR